MSSIPAILPRVTKEVFVTEGVKTIIYPVRDLAKAKKVFSALLGAVEPAMDQPYYVGFNIGGQDIGLDPNGHAQGMTGPLAYFHVADIRQSVKSLVGAGAEPLLEVKDVGGGKLIASVKDPDGNVIGTHPACLTICKRPALSRRCSRP